MLQLDEQADGNRIDLELDQKFEVRLKENRTAGFQWQVASNGEPACSPIDSTSSDQSTAREQVGQEGARCWHFQARAPGQGSIVIHYRRPWQHDAPPQRTFTLHVQVGS